MYKMFARSKKSYQTDMRFLTVLVTVVAGISADQFNYQGYKVYRVYPLEECQQKILIDLQNNNHVELLSPVRRDGEPVDVLVNPHVERNFIKLLKHRSIKQELLVDNIESLVEQERLEQLVGPRLQEGKISFTKYHRHNEINAYLDQLVIDYSDISSLEIIGQSTEGRDIKVIKISSNSSANKPIIFIDAGIHAREWIAPPVALYTINQLIENPENRNLLDKVDWHILPVVNPDGYEYSHDAKRLWRKTRSAGTECYGTDGNRNYGFHWGGKGSSDNECSEEYHGTHAFSESETSAIKDYVLKNKDRIKLYLTFHSHGGLILFPWGYTSELPEDSAELQALGESVADSIRKVAGTSYRVGSSTNVLYAAAGGSDDWVKGVAGVELSYTIELPSGGWSGFNPPPNQILPIVTETWEGVKTYHQYISNKFG